MDGSRFDDFARTFVTSRRGALKTLLRGAASGAATLLVPGITGLAQDCAALRRRCEEDAECCSGACDPASGRCACGPDTEECGRDCLAIEQFQTDVDNCGGCRNRCRQAPECQLPACIEGACGDVPDPDMIGQPCGRDGGVCGADGTCACPPEQPTSCRRGCVDTASDPNNCGTCDNRCPRTGHGSATCTGGVCGFICDAGYDLCGDGCCAEGRECCNGDCCGPNQCCTAAGICEDCVGCTIAGRDYSDGEVNPDNPCEVCDSSRSPFAWSPASTETRCGDEGDQCCNGAGSCDICDPDCVIDGKGYRTGATAPGGCAICDPARSTDAWTSLGDNVACGDFADRFCCNGACCDAVACCNEDRVCEALGALACAACRIDRVGYLDGDTKLGNDCQVCDSSQSTDAWSLLTSPRRCGDLQNQFCCNGTCCGAGLCCNESTGACEEGTCFGCVIDTIPYERGKVNPDNLCEYCDPPTSTDAWTKLADRFPCSDNWDRSCCGGVCACGPVCGMPDGKYYFDGEANPETDCEVCKYASNRVAWSPADDHDPCGEAPSQERCRGVCCADGDCCYEGTCVPCDGCIIDGGFVPDQTTNPANDCEYCDRFTSDVAWTTRPDAFPCENAAKTCCGGLCLCDMGCAIDGGYYFGGDPNPDPAADCEVCKPSSDRSSWSPADDRSPCGDVFGQECCSGVCCAEEECCYDGQCLECDGCTIDEVFYPHEFVNLDNDCLRCDIRLSFTAWSNVAANTACGANEDQFCCSGFCCELGTCCNQDQVCAAQLPGICDGCVIDDRFYSSSVSHPENKCQFCHPDTSIDAWTFFEDDAPCGGSSSTRFCCDGVCCEVLACCNEDMVCEEFGSLTCADCRIDRAGYLDGDPNPDVDCQICDPSLSESAWSEADDDSACGASGNQVCCAGACCPVAECCTPQGTCERCECETGAAAGIRAFQVSACDVCCGGLCCSPDECCGDDGLCAPCGCLIEGQSVADGAVNPDNACEVCRPAISTTDWSPPAEPTSCALDEGICCGRKCCNSTSTCCPGDLCCAGSAVCGECGGDECTIEGATFPEGALNPANGCETCNPFFSTVSWTVRPDDVLCGPDGTQFCCSGVCCGPLACCNADDICQILGGSICEERCEINGQFLPHSFINPANPCQECDTFESLTDWSPRLNIFSCGDDLQQTCCNGTCCDCCSSSFSGGVCIPCP